MKTYKRSAQKLRDIINIVGDYLSDDQAAEVPSLFKPWDDNTTYAVGERARYGENLYKCLTAHTSNATANWVPGAAPSLWTIIGDPAIEWPDWVQPSGSHDAYDIGSKVTYNGKHWINTLAANTYAPGVYGWEEAAK